MRVDLGEGWICQDPCLCSLEDYIGKNVPI